MLRLLRSSRSSGVENIIGAGVFRRDEKFCGGKGASGLSEVGEAGSESVEETERRLVRTGVRAG